jgi:hypothetical protein
MHLRKVGQQVPSRVNQADDQGHSKHEHPDAAWSRSDLLIQDAWRRRAHPITSQDLQFEILDSVKPSRAFDATD